MSYTAPYIDEAGLHIPTYQDILEDMISSMKSIYGSDIYLENDSADYQLLSIFALKQADTLQALADAYNSRSPVTAVGSGLDAVVKLNGIARKGETRSTCLVVLTGTPYTIIRGGICEDVNGIKWNLPATATIGPSGTATYSVTCDKAGAIACAAGDLNIINTPTAGWVSVVNNAAAAVGQNEETDAALRVRQSVSVAMPSLTLVEGLKASIAALENVSRCAVYENDTNVESTEGFPAHSVCCVVENGDDDEIAEQIYNHKTIGCATYGDVSVEYLDSTDYVNTINFFRPTYVNVHVSVTLAKYTGYVTSVVDDIKAAIIEYMSQMVISSDLSVSMLAGVIVSCNPVVLKPIFGIKEIKIGLDSGSMAAADIQMGFNEIPIITEDDIEVTAV